MKFEKCCASCVFWFSPIRDEGIKGMLTSDGECRRRSPKPLRVKEDREGGKPWADWAKTFSSDWCGEYQFDKSMHIYAKRAALDAVARGTIKKMIGLEMHKAGEELMDEVKGTGDKSFAVRWAAIKILIKKKRLSIDENGKLLKGVWFKDPVCDGWF